MVWGVARLAHRPETAWLDQLVLESAHKMGSYNAQNLANTVHALASLG